MINNDDNYLYSFKNKIINGVVVQTSNSKVKYINYCNKK